MFPREIIVSWVAICGIKFPISIHVTSVFMLCVVTVWGIVYQLYCYWLRLSWMSVDYMCCIVFVLLLCLCCVMLLTRVLYIIHIVYLLNCYGFIQLFYVIQIVVFVSLVLVGVLISISLVLCNVVVQSIINHSYCWLLILVGFLVHVSLMCLCCVMLLYKELYIIHIVYLLNCDGCLSIV